MYFVRHIPINILAAWVLSGTLAAPSLAQGIRQPSQLEPELSVRTWQSLFLTAPTALAVLTPSEMQKTLGGVGIRLRGPIEHHLHYRGHFTNRDRIKAAYLSLKLSIR